MSTKFATLRADGSPVKRADETGAKTRLLNWLRMDNDEARAILAEHLAGYRVLTYRELVERLGEIDVAEVRGASGAQYQLEIQFFWDGKPNGDLRVSGGIDDGGWRAFSPLSDSFIVAPDGTFVGE